MSAGFQFAGWSSSGLSDRLVALRLGPNADDPVIQYAYDYLGTRVGRSALDSGDDPDPDETRYLVDYRNMTGYSQTLAEVGEDDQPLREYIYGQDHGALAQSTPGGSADIFHADHLGTTRQLTDAAGRARLMSGPAGYSPFGEATSGDLGSLTSLAFTGQFREAATALQYHRARWYQPGAGRWLSEDPVWDFPGNFGNGWGYGGPANAVDIEGTYLMFAVGGLLLLSLLLLTGCNVGGGADNNAVLSYTKAQSWRKNNAQMVSLLDKMAQDFRLNNPDGTFLTDTKLREVYVKSSENYNRGLGVLYLTQFTENDGLTYKPRFSSTWLVGIDSNLVPSSIEQSPLDKLYAQFPDLSTMAEFDKKMQVYSFVYMYLTVQHEVTHCGRGETEYDVYRIQKAIAEEIIRNPDPYLARWIQDFNFPVVDAEWIKKQTKDAYNDILIGVQAKGKVRNATKIEQIK